METSATIVVDSISETGVRLTTLQLCYPLVIHSELMTHRVFARNARSSRAVPTAQLIEEVRTDPWVPVHIGRNQKGMQAGSELEGKDRETVVMEWRAAARAAADHAEVVMAAGAHKQIANRLLMPFLWMHTLVSATAWDNFFGLRLDTAAEPHMQELARCMYWAMKVSSPNVLGPGEWHLPYITTYERDNYSLNALIEMSVARCARVSYKNFDGTNAKPDTDFDLYDKLVLAQPIHASPTEHVATPDFMRTDRTWAHPKDHGCFIGWRQWRKFLPCESVAPMPEGFQ